MASFYVDYENVHCSGTIGIDGLSKNDFVYIFYSHNANSMNLETVKSLLLSKCDIEFIEADSGTANALDFQLITFLFSGIRQDDFHYIISKDHGFDAAVKMGNRLGMDRVKRYITIEEALKNYERNRIDVEKTDGNDDVLTCSVEKSGGLIDCEDNEPVQQSDEDIKIIACSVVDKYRKRVKDRIKKLVQKEIKVTLPKKELEISCDGIMICENKLNLYHYLRRELGDKRGKCVYSAISNDYAEMKLEAEIIAGA